MIGYRLHREEIQQEKDKTLYRKEQLELMTTHQLREICRREKLVQGLLNPLDKEELIHVIMRYRGLGEKRLILTGQEVGNEMLEWLLGSKKILVEQDSRLHIPSKLVVYEGLALSVEDGIRLPYLRELENTNALLISGGRELCGIFSLQKKKGDQAHLYLNKDQEMFCRESAIKDYDLYCFPREESERLYALYEGKERGLSALTGYRIPLLDVEVRPPIPLRMPLVIDFGSTNTTAGVYLDSVYVEQAKGAPFAQKLTKNSIHYTRFTNGEKLLPSVAGVLSIEEGKPQFVFGQEAVDMANACYVDEGFSIFYDMKRWISDYERQEEITDRQGKRAFLSRKEIIKAYFSHIITQTENQFKCKVSQLHVSCPVRQKYLFGRLFQEILPDFLTKEEEMLDEGVAVVYNTLSGLLETGKLTENQEYQALIVDCGGGTTDLCACTFRVRNTGIAYHVQMDTAYENGDTDFGGNNLTYRIMQLIKVTMAEQMGYPLTMSTEEILKQLDGDVYRLVDREGVAVVYQSLEEAYHQVEGFLPTCFRDYEAKSRSAYFQVKNNFYHLFFLAEQVKKSFFEQAGVLQVGITSEQQKDHAIRWVVADKWKLSIGKKEGLTVLKEFPRLVFNLYQMELLLKADIYGIIRKFMEPFYLEDKIRDFSFLKLTGQSCKIDLFKEAMKEFIPGKMIQFQRKTKEGKEDISLKMSCVEGALKFIRDKRTGIARIDLRSHKPLLPYTVHTHTHRGKEVELVNGFLREEETRYVSRNLEEVTLNLYLKDASGNIRCHFALDCEPNRFQAVTYEEIEAIHGKHILQKETDSIVNQEMRFFAWKRCRDWGYVIVPVYREEEQLYLGEEQFYPFEHEGWLRNFFDGTW